MTLLMISAGPDFAAIAADELAYHPLDASGLVRISKVAAMPHIDTLIASSGLVRLGAYATAVLESRQPADYDELVDIAPQLLRSLWAATHDLDPVDYLVMHTAGWSPARQSFTAHWLASQQGFEAVERESCGLVVVPPLQAPMQTLCTGTAAWVHVAEQVRSEQLAMADQNEPRMPIGGRLWYTEVTRGRVVSEVIHQFDDRPELWVRYLDGLGLSAEQIEHEAHWAQRTGLPVATV